MAIDATAKVVAIVALTARSFMSSPLSPRRADWLAATQLILSK
ncbi:hypothetical protein [Croceibacterium salegens]|nr:hypothetical protein [Croceibacterium salegens]